jgi:hypothetical protein
MIGALRPFLDYIVTSAPVACIVQVKFNDSEWLIRNIPIHEKRRWIWCQ